MNTEPNEALTVFLNVNMLPYISSLITRRDYSIEDIQSACNELINAITNHYKRCIHIEAADWPPPNVVCQGVILAPMASNIKDGVPVVHIFIGAWTQILTNVCGGDTALFETAFVTAFLHELIHLALKLAPEHNVIVDRETMYTAEEIVNAEACAIMRLFCDNKRSLVSSDQAFLEAWDRCGHDLHSQSWKDFVRRRYSDIKI